MSAATLEYAWAVVADGCSTGGRTDIGARMWSIAAERVLKSTGLAALDSVDALAQALLIEAEPLLAGFEMADGLATLGLLAVDAKKAVAVVFGDGVIVQRTRDDRLRIWNISYSDNAPRYLQYERYPEVLSAWDETYRSATHKVVFSEYDVREEVPELISISTEFTVAQAVRGYRLCFENIQRDSLGLAVMSDGAVSFQGLTPVQGLLPLMQVPNMVGQVTQRRLAALSRMWAKAPERLPSDDLAVGAIWTP